MRARFWTKVAAVVSDRHFPRPGAALATLIAFAGCWSASGAVELGGWATIGGQQFVVIRDSSTRKTSPWLKIGEAWQGHAVVRREGAFAVVGSTARPASTLAVVRDPEGAQERFIHVRGSPPASFGSKPHESLLLQTPTATYRVSWRPGSLHRPTVLEPGRTYDFVLIERSNPRRYGSQVWHDVWQVASGGTLLYDGITCEIHGYTLAPTEVPIFNGCIRPNFAFVEARKRSFPHANPGRVMGGDLFSPDELQTATVFVCAACDVAKRAWKPTDPAAPLGSALSR